MKKLLTILFACSVLGGCADPEPTIEYKYTVWIGDNFIASGYATDSYKIEGGFIMFTNKRSGNKLMFPEDRVYRIEFE